MGRVVTPKYRVEVEGMVAPFDKKSGMDTRYSYDAVIYGKPTDANLQKWIEGMAQSFQPGGVNFHVSESMGYVPVPNSARIVEQRTGDVVASWKAPMFWVVGSPEEGSEFARPRRKSTRPKSHKRKSRTVSGTSLGGMR